MMISHSKNNESFEELKTLQVVEGHKILGKATRSKCFYIGHGTEEVRYEEILEKGKLVHNKQLGMYGGSYGPLSSLLYTSLFTPHDSGNGLFIPDPELVKIDQIFTTTASGTDVDLIKIKWIVLPPCEAEHARSDTMNSKLNQYGIQIITYQELAEELGYIQDLNVVTACAERVLSDFKITYPKIENKDEIFSAIITARQLLINASEKGKDGIMEAALILNYLSNTLPTDLLAFQYRKDIYPNQLEKINASDNSWYAVLSIVDPNKGSYALIFSDRRKVDLHIYPSRAQFRTNEFGKLTFE